MGRRRRTLILQAAAVVSLVVLWEAAVRAFEIRPYLLPAPSTVWAELLASLGSGEYVAHVTASVARLAIGFVLGGTLGYALGIVLAMSPTVAEFTQPVVSFFQAIAGIAWIPLAIIWFGFGQGPAVFVIANTAFFVVMFNTMGGVRQVSRSTRWAVRTMGASRWDVVREVIMPGASVSVLAGIVSGLAFAWRALVAVEIIATSDGLGFMTVEASSRFDSAVVVLGVLSIGCIWLLTERFILRPIQRVTIERWGMSRDSDLAPGRP